MWLNFNCFCQPRKVSFSIRGVPSPDWCPCGDYWVLNNATNPDRYPIPYIQDWTRVSYDFRGTKWYSQNGHHYFLWLVRIWIYAFWIAKCGPNFSVVYPSGFAWFWFCLRLHRWLVDFHFSRVWTVPAFASIFQHLSAYGIVSDPSNGISGQSSMNFLRHRKTPDGITPLLNEI